jgi:hypothetical protein
MSAREAHPVPPGVSTRRQTKARSTSTQALAFRERRTTITARRPQLPPGRMRRMPVPTKQAAPMASCEEPPTWALAMGCARARTPSALSPRIAIEEPSARAGYSFRTSRSGVLEAPSPCPRMCRRSQQRAAQWWPREAQRSAGRRKSAQLYAASTVVQDPFTRRCLLQCPCFHYRVGARDASFTMCWLEHNLESREWCRAMTFGTKEEHARVVNGCVDRAMVVAAVSDRRVRRGAGMHCET